ncbi:MAG: S41 family peptidase [Steroidobacteraceae bacterium]
MTTPWTSPRVIRALAALLTGVLLASCGGGGGGGDGSFSGGGPCSISAQKTWVRNVTNEWYLFPDLLPSQVNLSDYADAASLLDAMTAQARAEGKDRFFSFLTTQQADNSFLQEGEFIGFGFRLIIRGTQVFFLDVYESSPAADAGLTRGGELLAVDSGSGFVSVAQLLQQDPNLANAFGPSDEGVTRGLRFAQVPTGTVLERSLTKRVVTIQPIPDGGTRILTLPTGPDGPEVKVGYLHLRTFISSAETPLRQAFAEFRAQGVQNLILDFRYNGGGLLSVAALLGDLLGALRSSSDLYFRLQFRNSKSGNNESVFFRPLPESVDAVSIAFITTGASASASELTVNSMDSWANVGMVGADTFGKPVGQSAFDLQGCDNRLRLVTFRAVNRDGEGDYYNGLAGTLPGAFCPADDQLERVPGDPLETSTATALSWLSLGSCPAPTSSTLGQKLEPTVERLPAPERPSVAQWHLPGLF